MRFKAKCKGCSVEFRADDRRLFGISVRTHEVMTGHTVKVK
ncbi:hypothetical protein SEA_HEXAMO_81 [Mycobacterium phage Hexamo]|nr:hypothetical protein FGG54_gp30 [Mycobacterium phage Gladiator]AOQ28095.1 hypothetical protein SEA_GRUUNAGA_81 [Mycobacterium phage Gruunaga]QAY14247.1 hypothetical protein SEA_HEXAMO_81 [Mycobacterium phage Hexamo]UQS94651.1 hypothetical protein SEA_RIFTER_82 [Mycobacterium Phage Rifter]WRQ08716.1 hypothetical protein JDBV06_00440 [Mycobacterium phage miche]AEJ95057.1 hypothetical protein GLADIATOR_78 [Mycobacterium phage Gladiator]